VTEEIWKPIPGYEGCYEVSNLGRVKSCARYVERTTHLGNTHTKFIRERILRHGIQKSGHHLVVLNNHAKDTRLVHRLVLLAFVGPAPDGLWGLHEDGDPDNNTIENLFYGTPERNIRDVVFHGGRILTVREISEIRYRASLGFAWGEQAAFARSLGLTPQYLNAVIRNRFFTHVV